MFACVLAAGIPAAALAADAQGEGAPAVAAAAVTSADVGAPSADADLVMWNVSAPSDEHPLEAAPTSRLGNVLHVQKFASGIASRGVAMASALTRKAMRFLGVRYSFGGTSAYGFDCSGYVQHVFAMMGRRLPRTADEQYVAGKAFSGQPRAGDLVFFHTYEPGVSHVGIALGGGRFVHASSSHGVTVSSLHDAYWAPRYVGAKRIVE